MRKILTLLAITAIFASCKKENTSGHSPVNGKKLVQIKYSDSDGYTETNDITYDAKGRLLTQNAENRLYNFSYESNTRLVVTSINKADGSPSTRYECALNDKGAVTEMVCKNPAGEIITTYTYTYDPNNLMTQYRGSQPNGQYFEYVAQVENGSITGTKQYRDGAQTANTVYYHDGTKANNSMNTLGGFWPSTVLFGKSDPFLLTEYKTTDMSGTVTWHAKVNYEKDADGYISTCTTTYLLDGLVSVATYKYQ